MRWNKFMRRLTLIILYIFISSYVFAGLSVNPSIVEIVVEKGKQNLQMFIVGNTGKNPINVGIKLDKFKREDLSVDGWLIFQVREFEVKPGETINVSYIVNPPDDAEGELRGRAIFNANEIGENRSSIGVRLNVPIYAIVQNTVKLDVNIKDINIEYDGSNKIFYGDMLVVNNSNVHIRPHMDFSIENIGTNKKLSYSVPYGQMVHKETTRSLFLKEENLELSPGKYKLTVNVDYGKMYGLKDYIVTKEAEFEVKPPEGEESKEKIETKQEVSEKVGGGE